jgi:kinesin family protein 5
LKKEAGIAERKLLARNERIQNLEALLQDADRRLAIQNQKFEVQLQAVRERLDQARGERDRAFVCHYSELNKISIPTAQKAASGMSIGFGRIAKPLRGGGGAGGSVIGVGQGTMDGASAGGLSGVGRVQNEDNG